LRAAAGACALSVGLLVCSSGGAVAVADTTETGGTSTEAQTGSSTAAKKPPTTIREALIALRDAFATTNTESTPSTSNSPITIVGNQRVNEEEPVEGTTTTTETSTTTDLTNGQGPTTTLTAQTNTTPTTSTLTTGTETTGTEATGVESTSVLSTAVETLTQIAESLTPSTEQVAAPEPSISPTAPTESTEPGESGAAAALAAANKSGSPTATTAAKPPPSLQTALVNPFSDAATTLMRAFGAAGMTLAAAPFSGNPIGDVITAVQILLTGLVNAVGEVAKVPGNLLNLLGFSNADGVRPPVFGNGGSVNRTATTPVGVRLVGNEAQLGTANTVAMDAPLFGNVVSASQFGGISPVSLNQDFATSGLAPVPEGINPAAKSFLDNVVRSVLVPASLTALAAIAVPGIAGLLIVCAAGIRVGYRQAKAGLALKLSGIARFAGSGPMGVVRSGSMISLHPRPSRVAKPQDTAAGRDKTAPAARHLESVA
jgi:hypothetical protein